MAMIHLAPSWFLGYDIFLEVLFAFVTLIVATFAFQIYKKTNQNQVKLFGTSFLCISISYFIQSFFNFLALRKIQESVCIVETTNSVFLLNSFGLATHIVFMTVGLSILAYMTFKSQKIRIFLLLAILSLLTIFMGKNTLYLFFLVSTIYLIFISWHFITNFFQHRKKKTLLIAVAFIFLSFGNFHFLVSVNHQLFYAIGHILELVAYLLILFNFYLVLKK